MRINVKFKFYDKKRKWLMDVMAIDWEKGIIVGLYGRQHFISLIEHGDLLQYTGLKDKYRKEIYEGNIMTYSNSDKKYEVKFIQGRFSIELGRPALWWEDSEVIGNIDENPELLKSD